MSTQRALKFVLLRIINQPTKYGRIKKRLEEGVNPTDIGKESTQ